MANVAEAQFIGNDTDAGETVFGRFMDVSNLFFTAIFTVELAINLFAHWLKPFLCNPWNLLDAFVVLMSLAALIPPVDIPITVLRLMRAFRVIRLFGRLKALKKMISALTASVVPMLNAFLILFIIASICGSLAARSARGLESHFVMLADSIIGVSIFGHQAPLNFGRFDQAFITMFRLTTDGGWPESISQFNEDGEINVKCALFFMTYIVVVNWVVLQASFKSAC
jgi:hypothetical protein